LPILVEHNQSPEIIQNKKKHNDLKNQQIQYINSQEYQKYADRSKFESDIGSFSPPSKNYHYNNDITADVNVS